MHYRKLLLRNGTIWDGSEFLSGDLAVENGKVVGIGDVSGFVPNFTYDASGKWITPGLIDAHIHLRGISPAEVGVTAEMGTFPFGVTAAADAAALLGGRDTLRDSLLTVFVFPDVALRDNRADFAVTEHFLAAYGERAVGIKVFLDEPGVHDETPLLQARDFARARNLALMVHSTGSPFPMSRIVDILDAGDILTHAYHGGKNAASVADLLRARKKGILLDAGLAGRAHVDFGILAEALAQGAAPDTISTDMTRTSAYACGGNYGLPMCMSILRTLGMPEQEVFRAVTGNAARALRQTPPLGALQAGQRADLAVLEMAAEPFSLTDAAGNTVQNEKSYRCCLTVCGGELVYRR